MNDREIMISIICKAVNNIKSSKISKYDLKSEFFKTDEMFIKDNFLFLYNNYQNIDMSCFDNTNNHFIINAYNVYIIHDLFNNFVDIYKSEELNIDNEEKYKFLLRLSKFIKITMNSIIAVENKDLLNMLKKQGKYPFKENYFLVNDTKIILKLIDDIICICCNKNNK